MLESEKIHIWILSFINIYGVVHSPVVAYYISYGFMLFTITSWSNSTRCKYVLIITGEDHVLKQQYTWQVYISYYF